MGKIKVIIKRPDEQFGHVCNISDSLKNLQATVGGYIETVTLDNGVVLICNEEGMIRNLPYNFTLRRLINHGVLYGSNPIFGTVIACGANGDEFDDIPIDFDEWKALLCEWGN